MTLKNEIKLRPHQRLKHDHKHCFGRNLIQPFFAICNKYLFSLVWNSRESIPTISITISTRDLFPPTVSPLHQNPHLQIKIYLTTQFIEPIAYKYYQRQYWHVVISHAQQTSLLLISEWPTVALTLGIVMAIN